VECLPNFICFATALYIRQKEPAQTTMDKRWNDVKFPAGGCQKHESNCELRIAAATPTAFPGQNDITKRDKKTESQTSMPQ
jgi:hypothetical protein